MVLHRYEARPTVLFCYVQGLLELPGIHRGSSYVTGLSGFHHIVQSFHRFLNRCIVVPTVDDVEVHIIHIQTLQAVVDFAQNGLAGQPGTVRALVHLAVDLRCNDHFIPLGKVLDRASEDFFASSQ